MTDFLDESIALWQAIPPMPPDLGPTYTELEQEQREQLLNRCLNSIESELLSLPRTRAERGRTRDRVTAAFVEFARSAMELDDAQINLLLRGGFSAIGTDLGRQARRFDPGIGTADIFQACRNAWTACGLQALLGRPMRVTPAIFAYSMLYPYSDNYLDDAAISRDAKLRFNARFRRRLAGENPTPDNSRETAIWRLVGIIESDYDRSNHGAIYESLLAIHHAQDESIRLLRGAQENPDVLKIIFRKGGASVLADAWLAGGTLSELEAAFAFSWGVALQLQDVADDRARGLVTLFTQAAGREPLDGLSDRTFHFAQQAMARMRVLEAAPEALKKMLKGSLHSLLIRAAGEAGDLYSKSYLDELERHSPFRFAFLKQRRRQVAKRSGSFMKLFEAFLAGAEDEPAFPLLPSTLMPR